MSELYDTDVLQWSERQSSLLRRRAAGELVNEAALDWTHIAEEIESVGASERAALSAHLGTIVEHLMKLHASPAIDPRRGWRETVLRARAAAAARIEDSPSLRRLVDDMVARELPRQRRLVAAVLALHGETARTSLDTLSFTPEQVLGDWFPDEAIP